MPESQWLAEHQNADGGWGDTVKSFSNISTTMLCRAALRLTGAEKEFSQAVGTGRRVPQRRVPGDDAEQRAEAIRRRYGKDRTFSVPILMTCALAGLVPWEEVPRLPFELACLPQSWYRFARMPVVSYALPALIAIGQCVHHHRGSWNPITNAAPLADEGSDAQGPAAHPADERRLPRSDAADELRGDGARLDPPPASDGRAAGDRRGRAVPRRTRCGPTEAGRSTRTSRRG